MDKQGIIKRKQILKEDAERGVYSTFHSIDLEIAKRTLKLEKACKKFGKGFPTLRNAKKVQKRKAKLMEAIGFYQEALGLFDLEEELEVLAEAAEWIRVAENVEKYYHTFYIITRLILPIVGVVIIIVLKMLLSG